MAKNEFVLGLVQMQCALDPTANMEKAVAQIHEAAKQGADRLPARTVPVAVLLQHARSQAVRPRRADPRSADRDALRRPRRTRASSWSRRCSRSGWSGCATTRRSSSTPTARCSASIARCTSRTIRCSSRSTTSGPATSASRSFDTKFGKVGTLVCWDQWFPEGARLTALKGAEVLVYPTAIGWHPREKAEFGKQQHDAWETIQRSHAIANGCYVAAINRVGFEPSPAGEGLEFWGASFVSDPFGVAARSRVAHERGVARRALFASPDGGRAPQLAVLPRPAHGRLRATSTRGCADS